MMTLLQIIPEPNSRTTIHLPSISAHSTLSQCHYLIF